MKKLLLLSLGHLFLVLGIIGAFLPVLPTTPFLLLAAFFYSKSSDKIHSWIINHKYFGPPISDWEKYRVIKLKSKIIATIMLILVIFFRVVSLEIDILLKVVLAIVLTLVLIYIWLRPSNMADL